MLKKAKQIEEPIEEPPEQADTGAARYPPEDVADMVKLKGFASLREMVDHFLKKMMAQYYDSRNRGGN